MGQTGCRHGSEFHLLRYLGYHRSDLNRAAEKETGGHVLDWLDFRFDPKREFQHWDEELKGLDFIGQEGPLIKAWKEFWPQTGNVQNWDAVGLLQSGLQVEYLLVEAKAHVEEIKSKCGASKHGGLPKIKEAFHETISANGFDSNVEKWLSPYYQYASRLASLHFLLQHSVPARLVFIYFLGDHWPDGNDSRGQAVTCPTTEQQWDSPLQDMCKQLGLKGRSKFEKRVHHLFLDVGGPAS